MCGLVGMIAFHSVPVEPGMLDPMLAALHHRGPDDAGSIVQGPVALGCRRLSILDLSPSGHQPMTSRDGRFTIVFNGEIYNYVELRCELEQFGYTFESSGDTEVLLTAYAKWGQKCLPKLNGMWAFLIYDAQRRTLFGSRDRFGVKPLYRYQTGEAVILASEIKAIRASGLYRGAKGVHGAALVHCGMLLEAHVQVGRQRQAQTLGAQQRDVARNDARFLQPLDAPQRGRGRQVHGVRNLVVSRAATGLKDAKHAQIHLIEFDGCRHAHDVAGFLHRRPCTATTRRNAAVAVQ